MQLKKLASLEELKSKTDRDSGIYSMAFSGLDDLLFWIIDQMKVEFI